MAANVRTRSAGLRALETRMGRERPATPDRHPGPPSE
jgi:hypothetical protein